MSERPPKQPLNDPEYTVPEYTVLLPSDEAKNSTVENSAKRCTTVIIILSLFSTIQLFLFYGKPIAGVETLPDLVVRMLGYPLLFVLIQFFLFWMTWKGHRWAHILILMYSAYEVLSRMYWFAQDFLVDSRYITC